MKFECNFLFFIFTFLTYQLATMKIVAQMLAEVYQVDSSFSNMKYDGLMGLAFQSMSENSVRGPMDALKSQGTLTRRIFSFCLYPQYSAKKSVLIVGGSDKSLYKEPMHFVSLSKIGYWQISMRRMVVGDGYVICKNGCESILDSGTTLIVGPQEDVHKLNTQRLKARKHRNGSYLIQCAHMRTLPTIVIEMIDEDGQLQQFPLKPSQYVRKVSTSALPVQYMISL